MPMSLPHLSNIMLVRTSDLQMFVPVQVGRDGGRNIICHCLNCREQLQDPGHESGCGNTEKYWEYLVEYEGPSSGPFLAQDAAKSAEIDTRSVKNNADPVVW